ncbi:hypothetical protein PMO31116_01294 [Pandoraea morbifera]|uniref:Uncharacterized protein n=1 Tax=Pandoraea morbifera TaxID=2508300 RepID=A0A5E4T9T1_9BURK|nr:hypothetical protein [Pandoraea morbifera]VVD85016.1 hypothetical protein PMO31116_01294 [Pandoraea morbifera]
MSLGFREHVVLVERDAIFAASRPVEIPNVRRRADETWRLRLDTGGVEGCAQVMASLPRGRLCRMDRLHVLAGFGLAHYQVVPWPDGARSLRDLEALATGLFTRRFGCASRGWKIAMTHATFGSPHLAVAVDGDWLDNVRRLVAQARLRWVSCRGVLHEVARRTKLDAIADASIAVHHTGGLSCLLRRGGRWHDACALPLAQRCVAQALDTLQTLCGADDAPLWLARAHGRVPSCDDDRICAGREVHRAVVPHPWLWEAA